MKIVLFMFGCLLTVAVTASAEDPSYEANFGLIQPSGYIIFYNSQGPLSYRTFTLKDLPVGVTMLGEVSASECQHAVSIPLGLNFWEAVRVSGALGNGGFKKAMENLHRSYPQVDGIFDVKIDIHELSVLLGLYTRACTEIVARGFHAPTLPSASELNQPDQSAAGHDVQ